MESKKGIFITFEGSDGVGKSTQVAFFAGLLESLGFDVLLLREPGGTKIGEEIREMLLDVKNKELTSESELLLYLAARSQIINEVIRPALEEGKIVLCDRFSDSTLAYQGYGRGIDAGFIKYANEFVCGGLVPDKTILFYIPEEEQKKRLDRRKAKDRIEEAGKDFALRVAHGFLEIAQEEPKRVEAVCTNGLHSETARHVIKATSDLLGVDPESEKVATALEALDAMHIKK